MWKLFVIVFKALVEDSGVSMHFHSAVAEDRTVAGLDRILRRLCPLRAWLILPISVVFLLLVMLDIMTLPYGQRTAIKIAAAVALLAYHVRFCHCSSYLVSAFVFAGTVVLSTVVKGEPSYTDDAMIFALEIISIVCTAIALPKQYRVLDILKACFWSLLIVNILNGASCLEVEEPESTTAYLFGSKFFMGYLQMLMLGFYASIVHLERKRRYLYNWVVFVLLFAACVGCLLHADAKTCLIGLVSLFVLALLPAKVKALLSERPVLLLFLFAANCLFFITVRYLLDTSIVQFVIQDVLGRSASLTGRTPIYEVLRDVVSGSPWFGWGYWNEEVASVVGWGNAQNGIMEVVVNQGLLGAAAFVAMLFFAMRRSAASVCPGLVLYLFAMIVCSLSEISFNVLFIFALSLVFSLSTTDGDPYAERAPRGRHARGLHERSSAGQAASQGRL